MYLHFSRKKKSWMKLTSFSHLNFVTSVDFFFFFFLLGVDKTPLIGNFPFYNRKQLFTCSYTLQRLTTHWLFRLSSHLVHFIRALYNHLYLTENNFVQSVCLLDRLWGSMYFLYIKNKYNLHFSSEFIRCY